MFLQSLLTIMWLLVLLGLGAGLTSTTTRDHDGFDGLAPLVAGAALGHGRTHDPSTRAAGPVPGRPDAD